MADDSSHDEFVCEVSPKFRHHKKSNTPITAIVPSLETPAPVCKVKKRKQRTRNTTAWIDGEYVMVRVKLLPAPRLSSSGKSYVHASGSCKVYENDTDDEPVQVKIDGKALTVVTNVFAVINPFDFSALKKKRTTSTESTEEIDSVETDEVDDADSNVD